MSDFTIDDLTFTYAVQRQNRKSLRMEFVGDQVLCVKAPHSLSDSEICRFLEKNAAWIRDSAERRAASAPTALQDGTQLLWLGHTVTLSVTISLRKPSVCLVGDKLTVNLYAHNPQHSLEFLLHRWYAQEAARVLTAKTAQWCTAMGTNVNRIAVKELKTRWGSCSARGNVNYNWRIVMAPEAIVDYLVVHELAHRFELNHSAAFWARVAAHCPDYRDRRRWLKENGSQFFQILS